MGVENLLRKFSLFSDLGEQELNAIAAGLGKRLFAKDAIIFHQGSPALSLYLIESGMVRMFADGEMGQQITMDVYGSGECFGETSLLDGNVRMAGAAALEKTVIYTMNRDDFLRCLELHPHTARRVMTLLAHRLEHATAYAENLVFLDVAGRVAAVLLELSQRYGTDGRRIEIDLHLTQTELASWSCASREMVNKVLHAYRDQGLITMEGHTLVIADPAGLKRKTDY